MSLNLSNKIVAHLLLIFVNFIFFLKYLSRLNLNVYIIITLFVFYVAALLFLSYFFFNRISEHKARLFFPILAGFTIFTIFFVQKYIDPLTVHVDRWSAISNFLKFLFEGNYPYLAQTHLGGYGSPFPVWNFFHIPFYLLGDVGYGFIFVLLIFIFVLIKTGKTYKNSLFLLFIIISSFGFWYEASVRSDLLYNMILCFLIILIIHEKKIRLERHFILVGILCGLLVSTRFTLIIPLFIYFFPEFLKISFAKKILFPSVILLTFIITFLPLVFWDFNNLFFFDYNPFVLQTRQGSFVEILIILPVSVYFSMKWKNDFEKYNYYVGVILFLLISVSFLRRMILSKFENSFFSPSYDIAYYNLVLPFLIYAVVPKFKSETAG